MAAELLPNGLPKYLDAVGHLHGGLQGSIEGTADLYPPTLPKPPDKTGQALKWMKIIYWIVKILNEAGLLKSRSPLAKVN